MPSVSHFSGFTDALDIVGYSYRAAVYDYCRERYPGKMIFGSENWGQWSEWKQVLEHEYLAGIFLWTGIHYLGESRRWPVKASSSGLLDLAGFETPRSHYFKSLWSRDKMVHITTMPLAESNYLVSKEGKIVENPRKPRAWKWGWPNLKEHWNYAPGEKIYVEIYSNCEEVGLVLNGRPLGTRRVADSKDHILRWVAPFEPGTLEAVGSSKAPVHKLQTAAKPHAISLSVDSSPKADVVHLVAQIVDSKGVPVRHIEKPIRFSIEGDATILGVDNGATNSVQDYQSNTCTTAKGRCLLVLRTGGKPGSITVTAASEGLEGDTTSLSR
jgi:hypothetical protein